MSAGFKYDLVPPVEQEERYDVQTGIRRRGPYKLDTANLVVGSFLPVFTPIYADLKNKFAYPVRNMTVAEAYTTGDDALTIKIAKGSLAYAGMFIGSGNKGAKVTAIDKSNANYDVLTIEAALGEDIAECSVLFEATTVDGTDQKYIANSALFNRTKVEDGIVLVALLRAAGEIEPAKLAMPFSDADKANMPLFQFNDTGVKPATGVPAYILPEASSSLLGGIKTGFAQNGKKYPVNLENGKAFVEVPWTDNDTKYNAATASAIGLVKQGVKVDDAGADDVQAKLNALLASLRTAGVIAK